MKKQIGTIILLLGASGSGKTTLSKALGSSIDNLCTLTYYTTREKREKEKEGVDYIFVSKDEFDKINQSGGFKYTYDCHGNYYGIPQNIDDIINHGGNIILGISRKLINEIQKDYTNVKIIYLDICEDKSKARIINRDNNISSNELCVRVNQLNDLREWAQKNKEIIDLFICDNLAFDNVLNTLHNYIREVIKKHEMSRN